MKKQHSGFSKSIAKVVSCISWEFKANKDARPTHCNKIVKTKRQIVSYYSSHLQFNWIFSEYACWLSDTPQSTKSTYNQRDMHYTITKMITTKSLPQLEMQKERQENGGTEPFLGF